MGFKRFLKTAGGLASDFGGELQSVSTALGGGSGSGFFNVLGQGFGVLQAREDRKEAEAIAKAMAAEAQNRGVQQESGRAPSNVVVQVPDAAGPQMPPWLLPGALALGGVSLLLALRR